MSTAKRSNEVDVIRMAALIGICVVNVPFIALPVESILVAPDHFHDRLAAFMVECFFQLKFFILFSFIFGWGMAIQSRSVVSKGRPFAGYYFRRMAGLALFGIVHAVLIFSGDILLLYALLGLFLWKIKDLSARQLMKFAAWMLPLSMLFLTILALLFDSLESEMLATVITTDGKGMGNDFYHAIWLRVEDWYTTFALLLFLQGPLALGAFAVGLAAAKTDFFAEHSEGLSLIRRYLPLLVIIALPLNALYAAVVGGVIPESYELLSLLGFVLVAIGAPALSLIYLYLFICFARKVKIPQILLLAGQNSLSSYITQGLLAGVVFGSYGMGLFDLFKHAALVPIALFIALLSMVFVGVYAKIFGRGPLEPILRKMS